MIKIAFSGKLCSGKTTSANIIAQLLNDAKILSFAGKLKELAIELFGMTKKDRLLLIKLGEKMREIDPDVWVNYLIKETKKYDIVIIDDLRFPNEYDALVKEGFILIRINITKEQQLERLKILYDDWENHVSKLNHDTEIALDNYKFNHYINATQSMEDAKQQLQKILDNYL